MESNYHLPPDLRPSWLQYPELFDALIARGENDFDLWYFMESERVAERQKGMAERYPSRVLVPFATRDDNDDVACWDSQHDGKVVIIHDFASAGHEEKEIFNSFEEWYERALKEAEGF